MGQFEDFTAALDKVDAGVTKVGTDVSKVATDVKKVAADFNTLLGEIVPNMTPDQVAALQKRMAAQSDSLDAAGSNLEDSASTLEALVIPTPPAQP